VSWNRIVVAAVAVLAVVAVADAFRDDGDAARTSTPKDGYRIDLESSREGTWLPGAKLREAFPGARPASLAVSKVAIAPDEIAAIGVSSVSGRRPARAAIELWDGDQNLSAFSVPAGSFARGLWFAGDGRAIATVGWDGRGYLYGRDGRAIAGTAFFAYETP
jgi:hypothetical protein